MKLVNVLVQKASHGRGLKWCQDMTPAAWIRELAVQLGGVEGSVVSAGEIWRENGKAGTGSLLRKALLCRGEVGREDCAINLSVTLQSSTPYCVLCPKT